MSVSYQAVGWNRYKKVYDGVLAAAVTLYLAIFVGVGTLAHPNATAETLLIRAFGTAALLLLHVILSIGPLCRLDRRFLPLLYNRRHLGVTMFTLALAHGVFSIVQFHSFGNLNPLVSLFVSNTRYNSVPDFPFQSLGFFALLILFLMATLGALQSETSPLLAGLLAMGLTVVSGLHLAAAVVERRKDRESPPAADGFVAVCRVESIPEKRACVVSCGGERIAVFKDDGRISAVSNVCQHQNGPLGEGRIIDGCITCPWHGYQYLPDSDASPPPFTEKVATYRTLVAGNQVFVHPSPPTSGTPVEPSRITAESMVIEDVQRT